MADLLNEMQSLVNQLTTMNMMLEDEFKALLLLNLFLDGYEILVVTLTNMSPNGVVTMSITKASILTDETRRKNVDPDGNRVTSVQNFSSF